VCVVVKEGRVMKPKKKVKKTVTLLTKIETLLSDVLDEGLAIEKTVEKNVRELLLSAQSSISSAIDYFTAAPPAEARHKPVKTTAKTAVKAKKRAAAPAVRKRAVKA
jgi:hypothetical protein